MAVLPVESPAFSLLIDHRKSLPVFRGDCWRCYACAFECIDFMVMANHIIEAHEPAPFNDEDYAEQWAFVPN